MVWNPPFRSWIRSRRTCSMLSDWIWTLLIDLPITCLHREPKYKWLCSAWRGYSSSKASMMVATSQSYVQWLVMRWYRDILQQSDRLTIDQIPQYGFIKSLLTQQLMEMKITSIILQWMFCYPLAYMMDAWIRIWTFVSTRYLLGELWDLAGTKLE